MNKDMERCARYVFAATQKIHGKIARLRAQRELAGFDYAFVILGMDECYLYTRPESLTHPGEQELLLDFAEKGYRVRIEEVLYAPDMAPILVPVLFVLWGDDFPDTRYFGNRSWGSVKYCCIDALGYEKMKSISRDVYSTVSVSWTSCANGCIMGVKIRARRPGLWLAIWATVFSVFAWLYFVNS